MNQKKRRHYDPEFKREAVQLARDPGRFEAQIVRDNLMTAASV